MTPAVVACWGFHMVDPWDFVVYYYLGHFSQRNTVALSYSVVPFFLLS